MMRIHSAEPFKVKAFYCESKNIASKIEKEEE